MNEPELTEDVPDKGVAALTAMVMAGEANVFTGPLGAVHVMPYVKLPFTVG